VHYRVSLLFLKDKLWSLFSVLTFATMVVSYISLRHADPYDGSLLILYFVFYKLIKKPILNFSAIKLFGLGMLAFFGYLCYPGYILLFLAIPMVLFFEQLTTQNWKVKLKPIIIFGVGSAFCLAVFEMASQSVGQSFIMFSKALSTSITQGSFEECFSFLFKYLYEVEGFTGVFLIFGLLVFTLVILYAIVKKKKKSLSKIALLFLVLFALFVTYSALGYYFEKVVWYARLLKQFIPFIIVFSVFSLQKTINFLNLKTVHQNSIVLITSVLMGINFYFTLKEYQSIYYPKDVAWDFYNAYHFQDAEEVFEYEKSRSAIPDFDRKKIKINTSLQQKLIFVNLCDMYPMDDLSLYSYYQPPKNDELVFSKKSFLNYKGYQFEGCKIAERANYDKLCIKIKVFKDN